MAIPLIWVALAGAGLYVASDMGNKGGPKKGGALPPKKTPPKKHPIVVGPAAANQVFNPPANLGQGSGSINTGISGPQPIPIPPVNLNANQIGWLAGAFAASGATQGAPPVNPFGLGADSGPAAKLQPTTAGSGLGKSTRISHPHLKTGDSAGEINLFG